jgi:hypothetical protein
MGGLLAFRKRIELMARRLSAISHFVAIARPQGYHRTREEQQQ